jgi:hypothetical protein
LLPPFQQITPSDFLSLYGGGSRCEKEITSLHTCHEPCTSVSPSYGKATGRPFLYPEICILWGPLLHRSVVVWYHRAIRRWLWIWEDPVPLPALGVWEGDLLSLSADLSSNRASPSIHLTGWRGLERVEKNWPLPYYSLSWVATAYNVAAPGVTGLYPP